jgi:hypothetical protein
MLKTLTSLILLFVLSLIALNARSQSSPYYPDAGSWNTFSVNYALNTKVTLLFTEELRLRENYSRLNLFYTNLGVEYKFNKFIKSALVYRWIDKYLDDDRFSFRHRFMWDATIKYPYRKFAVSYRHRLQVEGRNFQSSEAGFMPEWYSRNKIEISYNIKKKFSPYFATEFRYQIHDPRSIESDHLWHRDRYQLGLDYTYNKKNKFGIYYLIQREYNVSSPENLYITGLEYSLSLK